MAWRIIKSTVAVFFMVSCLSLALQGAEVFPSHYSLSPKSELEDTVINLINNYDKDLKNALEVGRLIPGDIFDAYRQPVVRVGGLHIKNSFREGDHFHPLSSYFSQHIPPLLIFDDFFKSFSDQVESYLEKIFSDAGQKSEISNDVLQSFWNYIHQTNFQDQVNVQWKKEWDNILELLSPYLPWKHSKFELLEQEGKKEIVLAFDVPDPLYPDEKKFTLRIPFSNRALRECLKSICIMNDSKNVKNGIPFVVKGGLDTHVCFQPDILEYYSVLGQFTFNNKDIPSKIINFSFFIHPSIVRFFLESKYLNDFIFGIFIQHNLACSYIEPGSPRSYKFIENLLNNGRENVSKNIPALAGSAALILAKSINTIMQELLPSTEEFFSSWHRLMLFCNSALFRPDINEAITINHADRPDLVDTFIYYECLRVFQSKVDSINLSELYQKIYSAMVYTGRDMGDEERREKIQEIRSKNNLLSNKIFTQRVKDLFEKHPQWHPFLEVEVTGSYYITIKRKPNLDPASASQNLGASA